MDATDRRAAADRDTISARSRFAISGTVDIGNASGPMTVEVSQRYQPIAFRWAENLRKYDAPEPRRFVFFWDQMSEEPSVELARTARVIPWNP